MQNRVGAKTSWAGWFLTYWPVVLCVFVLLPRLLSPQFGFFDDARTLTTAQNVLKGDLGFGNDPVDGRFRPAHWLWYTVVYILVGPNPFGFFVGNLALFMLTTTTLIRLARGLGFSRLGASVAGAAFALSGPILENIYTLSKPELQQSVWLVVAPLSVGLIPQAKTHLHKGLVFLLVSLAVFLACTSKETGVMQLPFALGCVAIQWLWMKLTRSSVREGLENRWMFTLAAGLAVAVYLVSRQFVQTASFGTGTYSNSFYLDLDWIKQQYLLWRDWLLRDFLYLLPLSWVVIVWFLRKSDPRQPVLFESVLWLMMWLIVYLPWQFVQEYYLLPLTLGAAILTGLLVELNIWAAKEHKVLRILAVCSMVSAVLVFAAMLPSNLTNIQMQLAVDQANVEMLDKVVTEAPQGSVVLINIQVQNEYAANFPIWINNLRQRPDLIVDYFQSQEPVEEGWNQKEIWIVSPFVENRFYPSMRMAIQDLPAQEWDQSLQSYLGNQAEPVDIVRYQFRSFNINPLAFTCLRHLGEAPCESFDALVDRRMFAYGWKIYRIR